MNDEIHFSIVWGHAQDAGVEIEPSQESKWWKPAEPTDQDTRRHAETVAEELAAVMRRHGFRQRD